MPSLQEHQQRSVERKRVSFDEWIADPLVRLQMSRIPPCEDSLVTLLRSCFERGFAAGTGDAMLGLSLEVLESMKKDK
jgi:hypothetical protein